MNGSTRHILTFLVILNSAFWVISQDVKRDYETIEIELVDASQVFNIQCDTIGTLAIRLWEYNGSAFESNITKSARKVFVKSKIIITMIER